MRGQLTGSLKWLFALFQNHPQSRSIFEKIADRSTTILVNQWYEDGDSCLLLVAAAGADPDFRVSKFRNMDQARKKAAKILGLKLSQLRRGFRDWNAATDLERQFFRGFVRRNLTEGQPATISA